MRSRLPSSVTGSKWRETNGKIDRTWNGKCVSDEMFQHLFSAAGQQRQILYGGCRRRNGVLARLEKANVSLRDIHDLFVTHKHTDHLLGVIWVIRNIGQMMRTAPMKTACTFTVMMRWRGSSGKSVR